MVQGKAPSDSDARINESIEWEVSLSSVIKIGLR
jgi:hypothetical protein